MYEHVDAALIRAVSHPAGLRLPPWPHLGEDRTPGQAERWRDWLCQVRELPTVVEAIEVASPGLAEHIGQVCDGRPLSERHLRRTVLSTVRYLLRLTGRATPFGLFAGVAPVNLGSHSATHWGGEHRASARPDAAWLDEMIRHLEAIPELREQLPVVANNLCFVRDERLVLPLQPSTDGSDDIRPSEVAVRHSRPVQSVMAAARTPLTVRELGELLAAGFPDAPTAAITGVLAGLIQQRFLITALHAPATVTDPLSHLVEQLECAGAKDLPQAQILLGELRGISEALAAHNIATDAARRRIGRHAVDRMRASCSSVAQPLMTDLRLDCAITLPEEVAREAATAAGVLARLTPYPFGSSVWGAYHQQFVERYGPGVLIPVTDLVHADTGLGFPATYRGSLLKKPASDVSRRDRRLLALAQCAAIDGRGEVVLNDRAVAELAVDGSTNAQLTPHVELSFRLQAASHAALDSGAFRLVVLGAMRAAGATAGRFLHLFDPGDRDRMAAAYARLATMDEGAMLAQVSGPPMYVRTGNVHRSPAVLSTVIPLAEHAPAADHTIPLDDLAVTSDGSRLRLVSLLTGRSVEPTVMNAVDFLHHTQPVVRFLCELVRSHTSTFQAFYWGAGDELPFLPRIRYGRTVLSPARWTLASAGLPVHGEAWPRWAAAVDDWRARLRVPDLVQLDDNGLQLRLDLDEPAHLALLRAHLDQRGTAVLTEAGGPDDDGWLDDRTHEIVLPLSATTPPGRPRRVHRQAAGTVRGHLPGHSAWLYAKVYCHPARQAHILTAHLPELLDGFDERPQWWFLRYADPEHHLRLRLRLGGPKDFGPVAARVGAWAVRLRGLGLVGRLQFDTYLPESGRFGGNEAMAAAERVFVADSAAAVAQLTATNGHTAPGALTAASFLDLATAFLGDAPAGMNWVVNHISTGHKEPLDRAVLAEAVQLAAQDTRVTLLDPGLLQLWEERRLTLAAYRDRLAATGGLEAGEVLPTLLHLHHIRTHGLDRDGERAANRLARAAALSWTNRIGRSQR
ncbi:lantibiotic dehydratase [Kitasatospora sp. NPDC094016]|uniref:lantibiotic dehydratase n=1 Tax=Kitasatospora sp. NPDC094016 TaxID=3154986 RepID=UPI0033189DA2